MQFYRLLGLDLLEDSHGRPRRSDDGERGSADVRHGGGSSTASFPDWTRANGNQVSLAFECASPAEVDEVYARVVAAGFEGEKEPWDAYWGQRYALLGVDPDGVWVNLYAALS